MPILTVAMGLPKKKTDQIREMLLNTVGKNPDLFCYYVSIQEAKELLNKEHLNIHDNHNECKTNLPLRKLTEG